MHVKDVSLFHGSDCSAGERGGLLDLSPMPVGRKRPRPRSNRRLRPPRLDSARHETFNAEQRGRSHENKRTRQDREPDSPGPRRSPFAASPARGSDDGHGPARNSRREDSPFADEVDQIQASASRDIGLATRELLQERANRLSSALDRLSQGGYGVCVECAGPIAPARLDAAPEVETCVRCQAGLERLGRGSVSSHRGVFAGSDIEAADDGAVSDDRRET